MVWIFYCIKVSKQYCQFINRKLNYCYYYLSSSLHDFHVRCLQWFRSSIFNDNENSEPFSKWSIFSIVMFEKKNIKYTHRIIIVSIIQNQSSGIFKFSSVYGLCTPYICEYKTTWEWNKRVWIVQCTLYTICDSYGTFSVFNVQCLALLSQKHIKKKTKIFIENQWTA